MVICNFLAKCIDEYVKQNTEAHARAKAGQVAQPIDSKLIDIVERMFARCFQVRHTQKSFINSSNALLTLTRMIGW